MGDTTEVIIKDINMSFTNMIGFVFKWVFASIIALICIWGIMFVVSLLLPYLGITLADILARLDIIFWKGE